MIYPIGVKHRLDPRVEKRTSFQLLHNGFGNDCLAFTDDNLEHTKDIGAGETTQRTGIEDQRVHPKDVRTRTTR